MDAAPDSECYAIEENRLRWRGPVAAAISNPEVDRYIGDATGYEPPLMPVNEFMPVWRLVARERESTLSSSSPFGNRGSVGAWIVAAIPVAIGAVLWATTPLGWWVLLIVVVLEWWLLTMLAVQDAVSSGNPDLARIEPGVRIQLLHQKREIEVAQIVRLEVVSVRYRYVAWGHRGVKAELHLVCCVRNEPMQLAWLPIIGGDAGIGGWNWGMPKELARLLGVPLRRTEVHLFKQC